MASFRDKTQVFYKATDHTSIMALHDKLKVHKDALSDLAMNIRQATSDLAKVVKATAKVDAGPKSGAFCSAFNI